MKGLGSPSSSPAIPTHSQAQQQGRSSGHTATSSSAATPQHPHGLAAFHDSRVMNNHPNEWRKIGLVVNTHVLELSLIKPPSVQGKAESSRLSKSRELAAPVHGLICSLLGHFRRSEAFSPSAGGKHPLKAELESLGLVFCSVLICSQWMLLHLEERRFTRLLSCIWACHQVLPSAGKVTLIFLASVSQFPTDTNTFLHTNTRFSHKNTCVFFAVECLPLGMWPKWQELHLSFLMILHRALRNSLGTLMGMIVSKTWVLGLRVGNLPGPRLQQENSRLEEML